LLAVPNFSEGRDPQLIAAVSAGFDRGATLLDLHSDPVHNRTVLSLAPGAGPLAEALIAGAAACIDLLDISIHEGAHPRIGSLDVCPVVFLGDSEREAARAEAIATAEGLAALGVPVFLYGELASPPERRERAHFRRGGSSELVRRMRAGELAPDLGPSEPHPRAGATLVTARPPLAAFNLLLDTGELEIAVAIAAELRESGGGPAGVRAMAVDLDGRAQVSTNIHDPTSVPLAEVIGLVRELSAERGVEVASGEVVGLVPEAALRGLEDDLPLGGFDPDRQVIERRLDQVGR
jgi:glutamate formiminotransferase/glutamate formiminotransferase/formiminotetrahydrofolate cyclodeaminase